MLNSIYFIKLISILCFMFSSVLSLQLKTYQKIRFFNFHTKTSSKILLFLRESRSSDADVDNLKIDESKLTPEEKERIKFIQKLTLEADEMIKAAGLDPNIEESDDDILEKTKFVTVQNTQWSGQSNVEISQKSSNNWSDIINRPLLAGGDVACFLVFAFIGRSQHSEDGGIFDVLITAFPFLLTWLTVSPLLKSYSREATSTYISVVSTVLPSAVISTLGGVGIRSLIRGYVPPLVFGVITLLTTSLLLIAWRCLYIKLLGGTNDNVNENRSAGILEVFKMVGTLIKRW